MNSDCGEGTSDIRNKQTHERKTKSTPNSNVHKITIKEEVKEEPIERSDLIEYSRSALIIDTNNFVDLEIDSDDQVQSDGGIDCVKNEIKSGCKEEEKSKKEDYLNENDQKNASHIENGDRVDGIGSLCTCGIGRRRGSNAINNSRNRILTKKRNMSEGSKKSRAKERKMHKCHLCKYTTSMKSHLTAHIRTHTGEKPYECEICSKTFAQKVNLNGHKKIHRSQFEFHCSKCRSGFSKQIDQINHEGECRVRQFECCLCKYSALNVTNLKRHMRFHHTGEKPFECSVCFKSFATKTHLTRHLRVHKKQLPLDCSQCGRRFAYENERQLHEDQCNGRRFECHLCGYKTLIKTNLKRHMQLKHAGDKQFKCLICRKEFVLKGHLNKHLAAHPKQRPFRCSKCLRGFIDKDDKTTHENQCRRRHFECYVCSKKYQRIRNLKSHMKKNHVE